LLVSGVCLYFVLKDVSLQHVLVELSQIRPLFLVTAILVVLVNNLAKAARWQKLIGDKGEQVHFGALFVAHMTGQTLNVVFPARLGDLSRAYLIGGKGPGRVFVLFTVLLEKIPDFIAYVALFAALLLMIPLPGFLGQSGAELAILTVVIAAVVLTITLRRDWLLRGLSPLLRWLPEGMRRQAEQQLNAGLSSLDVLQNQAGLASLVLWTVLIWVAAIGANHLVLLALDLRLPWTAALLVLVALQAGILVPSVPGKIGIFEYICIRALAVYGVGQTEALSYGILLHAVVFLPIIVLGLPIIGFLEIGEGHLKQLKSTKSEQL
jgi:uncharacterized protein (TIRG00374 family)